MTQTKITLTPEQEQAKNKLLAFINSDDRAIILQGHAGTGKTTIIKEVQRQRQAYEKLLNLSTQDTTEYYWEYTAMTHKAREALELALGFGAKTLHRFLGLRPIRTLGTHKGGYSSVKDSPRAPNTILVIDECSYLDYYLLEYLNSFLDFNPTAKIILMGDKNQLPPVGLNHCPVYYSDIEEVVLTQSVRQKDSPLIDEAASMFRNMVEGSAIAPITTDGQQVIILSKKDWDKQMITSFKEERNTKVIRHSNHQVNQTNDKLFKHFNERAHYAVGDVVICNKYHAGIYSDTTMVVQRIVEQEYEGVACFLIRALAEDGTYHTLTVPKKRSELNKRLAELEDTEPDAYRILKDRFADIRPMYACTTHKSQGSTYDEVFINLTDFKRMYKTDPKMTARLLYVAFSRAKHRVYLTGDIV